MPKWRCVILLKILNPSFMLLYATTTKRMYCYQLTNKTPTTYRTLQYISKAHKANLGKELQFCNVSKPFLTILTENLTKKFGKPKQNPKFDNSIISKMETIEATLKNIWVEKQLLLQALTEQTGIDKTLLSRIEKDKRLLTKKQVKLLCNFYKPLKMK